MLAGKGLPGEAGSPVCCGTAYFFLAAAFGLHMAPGMTMLDW